MRANSHAATKYWPGTEKSSYEGHACTKLRTQRSITTIMTGAFVLVRAGGAEGSRTPTGWNLNPVPLPVGLRPPVLLAQGSPTVGQSSQDMRRLTDSDQVVNGAFWALSVLS